MRLKSCLGFHGTGDGEVEVAEHYIVHAHRSPAIVGVSRAIHWIVGYSSYAVSSHPVSSASSLSVDISDDSMSSFLSQSVFRFTAPGGSCVYD